MKGRIDRDIPENQRRLNNKQISWVDQLDERGAIRLVFNKTFFTKADAQRSRHPWRGCGLPCLDGNRDPCPAAL